MKAKVINYDSYEGHSFEEEGFFKVVQANTGINDLTIRKIVGYGVLALPKTDS